MRSDKLITGLVLVLIGAAFLLHNFGYFDFHWYNLFRLWPVFLVMAGVNMVLAGNRAAWATIVKITVVIAGFVLILFADTGNRHNFWMPQHFQYNYDDDDNDDDDDREVIKIEGNSTYKQPFDSTTRTAILNIGGGGTSYILNDTTSQLFNAQTKEFSGRRYEFSNTKTDSATVLDFKMRDKKGREGSFKWYSDKENSATIKLNPQPEWEINLSTGASKVDFDLTKFKIKSLNLKGGAAAFDVKLGMPLTTTRVEVATGASEINIKVPKDAGCSIVAHSGLSSTDFDGFNKVGDHYETPGFGAAKNKIYIKMSGGVSDFNVSRY